MQPITPLPMQPPTPHNATLPSDLRDLIQPPTAYTSTHPHTPSHCLSSPPPPPSPTQPAPPPAAPSPAYAPASSASSARRRCRARTAKRGRSGGGSSRGWRGLVGGLYRGQGRRGERGGEKGTSWSFPLLFLGVPIRLDLLLRHLPCPLVDIVGLRLALEAESEAAVGVGDLGC